MNEDEPLVAGVEYVSGREPGGGRRFTAGRGRPLDIAGSTATASPIKTRRRRCQAHTHEGQEKHPRNFFQKPLGLR